MFSLLPGLCLFLLLELGLRLAGFQYSQMPLEMRYFREGVTRGVIDDSKTRSISLKKDKHQFWVPEMPFADGRPEQKPAGTLRIVTLGDSCTMRRPTAEENYPGILESLLEDALGGDVEVLNAGVGSHSSYQGLRRLEHTALPYDPDIVTIYYGWNDHWMSPIADKDVVIRSDAVLAVWNVAEHSRVFQALNKAVARIRGIGKKDVKLGLRVPPSDYRANLRAIVDLATEHGAKSFLVTAPYDLSHFRPSGLFPGSKEQLIGLHRAYNVIVREVAREEGAGLLDLERAVADLPQGAVLSQDGIHFHPKGSAVVARFLAQGLLASGLRKEPPVTTDVEYTLRVTDTASGEIQTYFNPLGVASPAITDTGAFATCP